MGALAVAHVRVGVAALQASFDDAAEAPLRAQALFALAILRSVQGGYAEALELAYQGLAVAEPLGDPGLECRLLSVIGDCTNRTGAATAASLERAERCVALAREAGDPGWLAWPLAVLGNMLMLLDRSRARATFDEGLRWARIAGPIGEIGTLLNDLARLDEREGDLDAALRRLTEALEVCRRASNRFNEPVIYCNLGFVRYRLGDPAAAAAFLASASQAARYGAIPMLATSLVGLALCQSAAGDAPGAARLHGMANAIAAAVGEDPDDDEVALIDGDLARLRAELGDRAFEEAYDAGAAMPYEAAVAYALAGA